MLRQQQMRRLGRVNCSIGREWRQKLSLLNPRAYNWLTYSFKYYLPLLFFFLSTSSVASAQLIPQTNWKVKFVDSQELVGENGAGTNAIDGNVSTFWHTQWSQSNPPPPHEIQVDLGGTYTLTKFHYLPRQDGVTNGTIKQYEFYVSTDGVNWGTAVATGTFASDTTEKIVTITATTGKFVRLRALSEINGKPWTSMAELRLEGSAASTGNQPPDGAITSPTGDVTIAVGGSVTFAGTGSDPDGNVPLSFRWNFGAGSGVPDTTVQNPGALQFNTPGIFTVTLTVTDSLGLADPTPATRSVTVQSGTSAIPQTNWRVKFVDSQELARENSAGENAIDGNVSTFWHTDWGNDNTPPPHEIQVDLGGVYTITKFHYLPRQDGVTNGTIKQYEFYVSTDGVNWGTAVATGTFASSSAEQVVTIPATTGKFVRLRALSEINGKPWTSMAELKLEGSCVTPSVKLLQPWDLYLQPSSNLLVDANACLSSGTQSGWGVRLVLDGGPQNGGAQFDDYTAPFAVTFSNVRKAEHTVEARLINNTGSEVSGAFTTDKALQAGIGDYYVAMGDSITEGYGDTIPADDNSQDGRQTVNPPDGALGGYPPILNNLLTVAKGYPQTIENEARGGSTSAYGLALLPALLTLHPDAQRYLILYGMNDARPWLPVPSGKGLHPGDPGYPGTFKDNVQRMLTLIHNEGKQTVLAKVNIALGDGSTGTQYPDPTTGARSALIQEYNVVIDELISDPANNITVPPPDFFSYFKTHYTTEYFDNIHPNGTGYQSMANLWFQALTQ